jgi:hypothetical protein
VELEAFLRSRGVDLGGEGHIDRATLVEIVTAIAVEEQREQQGGQGWNRDGTHSVKECWPA